MNTHFFVNKNKNVRAAVVARLLTLGKFWEMVTFMTTIYFHKTSRRLDHLPEGGHRRGLGRARERQRTRDDVLYRQTLGVRRELWLAAADRFWTVTDNRQKSYKQLSTVNLLLLVLLVVQQAGTFGTRAKL